MANTYAPAASRYDRMRYRRCGRSGLALPAISLGLWHNFGHAHTIENAKAMCCAAFDLGVTHFDLANNYGPPPGAAEEVFGGVLAREFRAHRDELIISTKAGYGMWPGPYGEGGSRKHLLASLDQSLTRLGVDYVDILYSHRFDPDTPLEETMGALDAAVRQGKALYVGISSYNAAQTREAASILKGLGTPCLVNQPRYSMIDRWVEGDGLLDALEETGLGAVVFSPLAQGVLTNRYLDGVPADSRAALDAFLKTSFLSSDTLARVRALGDIAARRGQSLAQLALAWVLRDDRVTSAIIGASRPSQITECVKALDAGPLTAEDLAEIDEHALGWRTDVAGG